MYGTKITINLPVHHVETILSLMADKVDQLQHINDLLDERNETLRNEKSHDMGTIAVLSEENEKLRVMLTAVDSMVNAKEEAHG